MKNLFYLIVALILMTGNISASEIKDISGDSFDNAFLALQDSPNTYQVAATYFLPDHIGSNLARVNESGVNEEASVACATYGALASCPESTMDFTVYYPLPSKKNPVCVKNCKCSPLKYKFTTGNCPDGYVVGGNTCGGKFESCEATSCPSGSKTDQSCPAGFTDKEIGKSGAKTCYSCEAKACPTGTATDKTCGEEQEVVDSGEKSGTQTCFGCKDIIKTCEDVCSGVYTKNPSCNDGQTKESCSSECGEWKRCVGDPCKGVPAGNCTYPCDAASRNPAAGCNNYCLSCGTCPVNDCSGFNLTNIPNNASVTGCKIGCGDETEKFKLNSCNDGYGNYKNYWCNDDLSCWMPNPSKEACIATNCAALGYVMTTAQCAGEPTLRCPYDQSKIFCAICTPPSGYTLVADGNLYSAAFKSAVKKACRVEENFVVTNDECGKVYYKCAIPEVTYKYTVESCAAISKSGSTAKRVVSGSSKSAQAYAKRITMYTTCDCPSSFKETRSCSQIGEIATSKWQIDSGLGHPYCYEHGHGRRDHTTQKYDKACNWFNGNSLIEKPNSSCVKDNGIKYYAPDHCECNASGYYYNAGCYGDWDKDAQWCQVCVDSNSWQGHVTNW